MFETSQSPKYHSRVQTATCELLAIVRETDSRYTGDTLPTARLTLASCYNFTFFKWLSLSSNNFTCVIGSFRWKRQHFLLIHTMYSWHQLCLELMTCIFVTWKWKVVVPSTNCSCV